MSEGKAKYDSDPRCIKDCACLSTGHWCPLAADHEGPCAFPCAAVGHDPTCTGCEFPALEEAIAEVAAGQDAHLSNLREIGRLLGAEDPKELFSVGDRVFAAGAFESNSGAGVIEALSEDVAAVKMADGRVLGFPLWQLTLYVSSDEHNEQVAEPMRSIINGLFPS